MLRLGLIFLLGVTVVGTVACNTAPTPSEGDLAASAEADEGAFSAFDDACLGSGDLNFSVPRAEQNGWLEFTPSDGSMMADYGKLLRDGPVFDQPEVVFLRNMENRAEIVMREDRTLSGSDYIFTCEVVEAGSAGLDLDALRAWADVEIELRPTDSRFEFWDLYGGRFRKGLGGKATAYFVAEQSQYQATTGLVVSIVRSSHDEEGDQ